MQEMEKKLPALLEVVIKEMKERVDKTENELNFRLDQMTFP